MPIASRRTQAARRASSEAALLAAAAEVIAESGPDAASLRSIGERAGVSRATPGYFFGSKDALLGRLALRAGEETLGATAAAVARGDGDLADLSRLDALAAAVTTYLARLAEGAAPEERALLVLWGAALPSERPLPAVVHVDDGTARALAQMVEAGQAEGSIRPDIEPMAAAIVAMGLARGVAAMTLLHPDLVATTGVQELCREALMRLLGPR